MKKRILGIILLVAAVTAGWVLFQESGTAAFSVTPDQAANLIASDSSLTILDVRTVGEYRSRTGHIEGALLIPVQELSDRILELEPFKEGKVLVYCRTDNRSRVAISILKEAGFDARFIVGGISRWNREGRPVENTP